MTVVLSLYLARLQRFADGGDYDDKELEELDQVLEEPRKEASHDATRATHENNNIEQQHFRFPLY